MIGMVTGFIGGVDQSVILAWCGTAITMLAGIMGFVWQQYHELRKAQRKERDDEREASRIQLVADHNAAAKMAKALELLEEHLIVNSQKLMTLHNMHKSLIERNEKCPYAIALNETCTNCEDRAVAFKEFMGLKDRPIGETCDEMTIAFKEFEASRTKKLDEKKSGDKAVVSDKVIVDSDYDIDMQNKGFLV